jgi:hypothetical protein
LSIFSGVDAPVTTARNPYAILALKTETGGTRFVVHRTVHYIAIFLGNWPSHVGTRIRCAYALYRRDIGHHITDSIRGNTFSTDQLHSAAMFSLLYFSFPDTVLNDVGRMTRCFHAFMADDI